VVVGRCCFKWHYFKSEGRGPDLRKWRGVPAGCVTPLRDIIICNSFSCRKKNDLEHKIWQPFGGIVSFFLKSPKDAWNKRCRDPLKVRVEPFACALCDGDEQSWLADCVSGRLSTLANEKSALLRRCDELAVERTDRQTRLDLLQTTLRQLTTSSRAVNQTRWWTVWSITHNGCALVNMRCTTSSLSADSEVGWWGG